MKVLIFAIFLSFGLFTIRTSAQETPNFKDLLTRTLAQSKRANQTGIKLSEVCNVDEDSVAARVFADYGAMFVAALVSSSVKFPNNCILDSKGVQTYQEKASPTIQSIGRVQITLQKPAMDALLDAIAEAKQKNLAITPRGGSTAGSRSYEDTSRLWNSRFLPGLNYWVKKGKISRNDAETVKKMSIHDQVQHVLDWESQRLWFSTAFDKSILYSVAAPGASQHVFMLALDVEQFGNKQVRDILAKHGWFQTVQSDLPHFTYLGIKENDVEKRRKSLNSYGLTRKVVSGQEFWIPNL